MNIRKIVQFILLGGAFALLASCGGGGSSLSSGGSGSGGSVSGWVSGVFQAASPFKGK